MNMKTTEQPGSGGHTQALVVQADARKDTDDAIVLYRDGAVAYRVLANLVTEVAPHPNQADASAACRTHRETMAGAGAASFALQESGAAGRGRRRRKGEAPRGATNTAIPAEGIRVVLSED